MTIRDRDLNFRTDVSRVSKRYRQEPIVFPRSRETTAEKRGFEGHRTAVENLEYK